MFTQHRVWVNVADAKARGIKDNDLVRIYNDMGESIVRAYVTSRISPGVVLLRHGAWFNPNKAGTDMSGCPNTFVNPLDKAPHWPAMVTALVEIEAFAGMGFRGEY